MSSTTPTLLKKESEAPSLAAQSETQLGWREVAPLHRIPVVTKTPVMIMAGAYLSKAEFRANTVFATMALGSLLWAVLYYYNEVTDVTLERERKVKRELWTTCFALTALTVVLGFLVGWKVGACLFAMAISQWAYCSPYVRLKRFWQANILLSGTINPILRFTCGAVWGTVGMPWLLLGMYVLLNIGASLRTRTLLRRRDAGLGYSQPPVWMEAVGKATTFLGFSCAFSLILRHGLPRVFLLFLVVAAGYAVFAWSGRVTQMRQLRRGWILFAALSVFAIMALFLHW